MIDARRPISATAYFATVALLTLAAVGLAMLLRPSFAYSVRDVLGLEKKVEAAPDSFFAQRIVPVLEKQCIGCHGENRSKGRLRLDSFNGLLRGGKQGAVIIAGHPGASELIRRILLPQTDEKAMPPAGKPPLASDDVTVIRLWIEAGASPLQPVSAIKGAPPPVKEVAFPLLDEAAAERDRAPLAGRLRALQARYPGLISYVSRGSADLIVNASLMGPAFGDADLAALGPLAQRIVVLDLSRTAVSGTSAAAVSAMSRLQWLRVWDTRIEGAWLDELRERGIRVHAGSSASAGRGLEAS